MTEGTGQAFFAKYDDGWRVDNSMTSLTSAAQFSGVLPITPEERNQINSDVVVARQKATEARRKKEELDRKMAESRTPTATLAQIAYAGMYGFGTTALTITNTNWGLWGGQGCWFGDIKSISTSQEKSSSGKLFETVIFHANSTNWNSVCNGSVLVFSTENERNRFLGIIQPALQAWQQKYGSLH